MASESAMAILDYIAIAGIGLEIFGFTWLLKYLRSPTWSEHKKWIDRIPEHKKTEEFWANTTVYHDVRKITEEEKTMADNVNIGFLKYWQYRKEIGIFFVIIGLALQIIQIGVPHIFQ